MKTYNRKTIVYSLTSGLLGSVFLLMACDLSTHAQNGTFSASETWTVTIAEDNGQTPTFSKTYQGTATGTLTVSNGNYALIDQTGLAMDVASALHGDKPLIQKGSGVVPRPDTWHTPGLDTNRVIYGDSGGYEIDGSYPVVGFSGNYAIVQLSFFMLKVQLPVTDFAIPVIDGGDVYTTTGSSLASLSGAGDESDDNTGFSASASSTSSLTPAAPPPTVAPKITSQPVSQAVLLGANAAFSVNATGTQPLSFQWSHGGTNLVDGGEFDGSTNSTLTISGVEAPAAGSYSVIVSDVQGSVISSSAVLTIVAPIGIVAVGRGTVNGATNGQLEAIGRNMTLTETPAAGYVLTNWLVTVNGATVLSTNKAAPFPMQPNLVLTATFADVQKPVLTITAPKASERVSNAVFMVAGSVRDNGPGGAVWYQLNGGLWNAASGWSNWTAGVTLNPGTNTVAAYAVDAAGNRSVTNSQRVVYVLSEPIGLVVVGDGTLGGATNGQLLPVGKSVTLTAKPAAGCVLTNWLVTVNGLTVLSTNKAEPFSMQSNLVLTATFADVTRPACVIISPTASASYLSNGLATVQVKATDNVGVANVEFILNGQNFGPGTSSGSNLWSMNLVLAVGTNVVTAVAYDFSNNSATNSIRLTYVNSQAITLSEEHSETDYPSAPGLYDYNIQDAGLFNVTLPVPALQSMSDDTWSNLYVTVSFGDLAFIGSLSAASVLTTNEAVFYPVPLEDPNVENDVQLTIARTGNTLLLAARAWDVPYQGAGLPPFYFYTNYWYPDGPLPIGGRFQDQQPFNLLIQDGATMETYANVARAIYITGQITENPGPPGGDTHSANVTGAADYTPPAVSIIAPVSSQRLTNATVTVKGTAHDNIEVSNVWCQINGQGWQLGTSTNHWTNWTAIVTLTPGTNAFSAYAVDTSGNCSPTNSVDLVSSPTSKLRLAFADTTPLKPDGLAFSLHLSAGLNGRVEVSTNLMNWTTLANFVGTNAELTFRDPAATNSGRRFYRAVIP